MKHRSISVTFSLPHETVDQIRSLSKRICLSDIGNRRRTPPNNPTTDTQKCHRPDVQCSNRRTEQSRAERPFLLADRATRHLAARQRIGAAADSARPPLFAHKLNRTSDSKTEDTRISSLRRWRGERPPVSRPQPPSSPLRRLRCRERQTSVVPTLKVPPQPPFGLQRRYRPPAAAVWPSVPSPASRLRRSPATEAQRPFPLSLLRPPSHSVLVERLIKVLSV
jgi:hypothetical protein